MRHLNTTVIPLVVEALGMMKKNTNTHIDYKRSFSWTLLTYLKKLLQSNKLSNFLEKTFISLRDQVKDLLKDCVK